MPNIGRLFRTVRHLKARQLYGRLWFRVARPVPDLRPAPPVAALRQAVSLWARRRASMTNGGEFTFLNETYALGQIGWDNPAISKLWRYNLHYFDDLNAQGSGTRETAHRALIYQWREENPPASGTGWEPYPTSLRIINWIKWRLAGNHLDQDAVDSLAVQCRWLARRLEWHLLGNHLFANAKALFAAGMFFEGEEAARWRSVGIRILTRELAEQVLADGGQFERSPMYHALALEDVLDLLNIICAYGSPPECAGIKAELLARASSMLDWLRVMSFPDGGVTHFNDSADGIAPPLQELERLANALGVFAPERLDQPAAHLDSSGYLRLTSERATIWIDIAPVGPDYIPGHAHADTLSFEVALDGQRLLLNGGTSCYGLSAERLAERGTAAHNTLKIGETDSSEVWSGFRVGRRAHPQNVVVAPGIVSAEHDGYVFLPGRPRHHRRWTLNEHGLIVEDRVTPSIGNAIARFHFAPGLEVMSTGDAAFDVLRDGRRIAHAAIEGAFSTVEPATHAPEFGVLVPTVALVCRLLGDHCRTKWTWIP